MFLAFLDLPLPQETLNRPLSEWQLNLTSLVVLSIVLGRVITAIRDGGGIKGIAMSVWVGKSAKRKKYDGDGDNGKENKQGPKETAKVPANCPLLDANPNRAEHMVDGAGHTEEDKKTT